MSQAGAQLTEMGMLKMKKRAVEHSDEDDGEEYQMGEAGFSDDDASSSSSGGSDDEGQVGEGTGTLKISDDSKPVISKKKVMILASRGINARQRHLLDDMCLMMPHFKKESKFDSKRELFALNELAELNGCSHTVYFESRKPQELFMWLAKCPAGPSVRFHVQNIYTLEELHLTGNCMKNTRPILTFDPALSQSSHGNIIKELLTMAFGVPKNHRKTRPYIDHVMHFGWSDNRIWVRNYQIKEGVASNDEDDKVTVKNGIGMEEVGPRFVLHPVMVLEGSFSGRPLWRNPNYTPMAVLKSASKYGQALRHKQRVVDHGASVLRKKAAILPDNDLDHVFD